MTRPSRTPPTATSSNAGPWTRGPSKTLVGGTNVMVWLKPIKQIRRYITEELAACPNHRRIILTTAGVAPPACPAETFLAIGEWIRTLPLRM